MLTFLDGIHIYIMYDMIRILSVHFANMNIILFRAGSYFLEILVKFWHECYIMAASYNYLMLAFKGMSEL